jgi:MFS family permease
VTHNLGGYTKPKVLSVVCFMGFLTSVVGIPIPFVDNYFVVTLMLWVLLFLGGFMMPSLTGMIISAAPRNQKSMATSFAFFCYNLFGYLPAPFLYGIVQNLSGWGQESRLGMGMLMLWTVFGNVFL